MRRSIKAMPLAVLLAMGVAGTAFAGTTYHGFSTTVGKLNGSGYTQYQTKNSSGTRGNVITKSVGGTYKVDARLQSPSGGTGAWSRDLTDGSSRELSNNIAARHSARVHFSNGLTTPVAVQVAGSWRSN